MAAVTTRPSHASPSAARLRCLIGSRRPRTHFDDASEAPGREGEADCGEAPASNESTSTAARSDELLPMYCSSAEEWQACVTALVDLGLHADAHQLRQDQDSNTHMAPAGPLLHLWAAVVPPADTAGKLTRGKTSLMVLRQEDEAASQRLATPSGAEQPSQSLPSSVSGSPRAAGPKGGASISSLRSKEKERVCVSERDGWMEGGREGGEERRRQSRGQRAEGRGLSLGERMRVQCDHSVCASPSRLLSLRCAGFVPGACVCWE